MKNEAAHFVQLQDSFLHSSFFILHLPLDVA
jgi:hypothetical protein